MTQQLNPGQTNANLTPSGSPPLTITLGAGGSWEQAYCTDFVSTGQRYWEVIPSGAGNTLMGIGSSSASITEGVAPGFDESASAVFRNISGGIIYASGNSYPTPSMTGARLALAWKVGGGVNLLWASDVSNAPGVWYGASGTPGNPAAATGGADITTPSGGITGTSWTPGVAILSATSTATLAFASGSWLGSPPSGFVAFDVVAGGGGGGLLLFGGSIMCGWTPPSLPFLGAAAAWKAGQAVRRNATLSRRALIGKR